MTRKVDTFMPLFIGDYRKDTSRLTTEQHGAYLLLIIDYWTNGPPPNDDGVLAQIVLQDVRGWKKIRPHVERFFRIDDGAWRHKRVDEELEKARARRDVAAENGRNGGRPRKPNITQEKPSGLAGGNPEHNPQESSSPSPLPSEVNLSLSEREQARSDLDRMQREVIEAGGEGIASRAVAPGIAVLRDLVILMKADPPCDWTEDILPAVQFAGAWYLKKRGLGSMANWDLAVTKANEFRDKRLAGLPTPKPLAAVNDHDRSDQPSAKFAAKQANLSAAQRGAEIAAELRRREEFG